MNQKLLTLIYRVFLNLHFTFLISVMNQHLQFLQGFIKKPTTVGAIAPSSPELARKMIEDVNTIVEKVRKDEQKKAFWGKITWGTYGTVIGTIIGIVVMSL